MILNYPLGPQLYFLRAKESNEFLIDGGTYLEGGNQ